MPGDLGRIGVASNYSPTGVNLRTVDAVAQNIGAGWVPQAQSNDGRGAVEFAPGPMTTIGTVQTTDATVTDCGSFVTLPDTAYVVTAHFIGRKSDSTQAFGFVRTATFVNNSGTLSLVDEVTTDHDGSSDPLADGTLIASGALDEVKARVTGLAATTIDWTVILSWISA